MDNIINFNNNNCASFYPLEKKKERKGSQG